MLPDDVEQAAHLLAESFDARLRPYMVYTQRGIGAFLAVDLAHPDLVEPKNMLVVGDGAELAAFAEFRLVAPDAAHLSYICVAASHRRQGLARQIISHFIEQNPAVRRLELFVFDENTPARRLYEGLGFGPVDSSGWYTRGLPSPSRPLRIPDLHAVTAVHERYGFSRLELDYRGHRLHLGRLGDRVLRCYDTDSFADDELLAALRASFPSLTECLLITSPGAADALPPAATQLLLNHRMAREQA